MSARTTSTMSPKKKVGEKKKKKKKKKNTKNKKEKMTRCAATTANGGIVIKNRSGLKSIPPAIERERCKGRCLQVAERQMFLQVHDGANGAEARIYLKEYCASEDSRRSWTAPFRTISMSRQEWQTLIFRQHEINQSIRKKEYAYYQLTEYGPPWLKKIEKADDVETVRKYGHLGVYIIPKPPCSNVKLTFLRLKGDELVGDFPLTREFTLVPEMWRYLLKCEERVCKMFEE